MYPSTQTCPRCHNPVAPGATVCGTCGQVLTPAASPYGPPPGASYGTLPASDPYAGGSGSYNANPPPTYYNSPGGMGVAPTVVGSTYPPEPPPPPPGGGFSSSQPPGNYPPTMQAAYPGSGPSAAGYPGSVPPPPVFPGTAPAYTGSQPQPGFPGGGFAPSAPPTPPSGGGKKVALIVVAVLVVLAAVGGGVGYYLLTRPKPTITVSSQYTDNGTPVGADGTVLTISGQKFSSNSSITFLLDGQPAPGSSVVQSDSDGNFNNIKLPVSKDWSVGSHKITAKDAKDYVTQTGVPIEIVKAGEKKTPGPNGAPTNSSQAFTLNVKITFSNGSTLSRTLVFTPKDDTGGTICQARDDGAQHTINGTFTASGETFNYVELAKYECKGTYAYGHVNYQEVATQAEFDFDNGVKCHATTPYNEEVYIGDFTNPTTISGTWNADSVSLPDCTFQNQPLEFSAESATWTGTLSS